MPRTCDVRAVHVRSTYTYSVLHACVGFRVRFACDSHVAALVGAASGWRNLSRWAVRMDGGVSAQSGVASKVIVGRQVAFCRFLRVTFSGRYPGFVLEFVVIRFSPAPFARAFSHFRD